MIALTLRQAAALLALALLPALVSGAIQLRWNRPEPLAPGEVTMAMIASWKEPVRWVDARPQSKYEREHVPGAVLLNEDDWDTLVPGFLDAWDPAARIVVYCDGGGCEASHEVARRLREELKLENVWVLKGGWDAWLAK